MAGTEQGGIDREVYTHSSLSMLTDIVCKSSKTFCLEARDQKEWGRRRDQAGLEERRGRAAGGKRKVSPEFNLCPSLACFCEFGLLPLPHPQGGG